jgi:hypothetical protein
VWRLLYRCGRFRLHQVVEQATALFIEFGDSGGPGVLHFTDGVAGVPQFGERGQHIR